MGVEENLKLFWFWFTLSLVSFLIQACFVELFKLYKKARLLAEKQHFSDNIVWVNGSLTYSGENTILTLLSCSAQPQLRLLTVLAQVALPEPPEVAFARRSWPLLLPVLPGSLLSFGSIMYLSLPKVCQL